MKRDPDTAPTAAEVKRAAHEIERLLARRSTSPEADVSISVLEFIEGMRVAALRIFASHLILKDLNGNVEGLRLSFSATPLICILRTLREIMGDSSEVAVESSPLQMQLCIRVVGNLPLSVPIPLRIRTYARASGFELAREENAVCLNVELRKCDYFPLYDPDYYRNPFLEILNLSFSSYDI